MFVCNFFKEKNGAIRWRGGNEMFLERQSLAFSWNKSSHHFQKVSDNLGNLFKLCY